ncbi:hypothetical protein HK096_008005 [Nowakowskiella sp. JEL0078]|nr:hypothetical protein HK096_008005 [Nowakowskiella sp. JEL0078]
MTEKLVDACCQLGPAKSDYVPIGEKIYIDGQQVYITGEKGKPALIVIFDIFGFHVSTEQVADLFASQGFRVAMPDLFRGNPWPLGRTIDYPALVAHLNEFAPIERVSHDTANLIKVLKDEGSSKFVVIGFCWGGSVAIKLAIGNPEISAVASAHPSFLSVELVKDLNVPLCLIPSKDDADQTPFINALKEKSFASLNHHVRFDDVHHGFWCVAMLRELILRMS